METTNTEKLKSINEDKIPNKEKLKSINEDKTDIIIEKIKVLRPDAVDSTILVFRKVLQNYTDIEKDEFLSKLDSVIKLNYKLAMSGVQLTSYPVYLHRLGIEFKLYSVKNLNTAKIADNKYNYTFDISQLMNGNVILAPRTLEESNVRFDIRKISQN
jgi:hypothetical protein